MSGKKKDGQISLDENSALLQSDDGQGVLPYSLIHNNSSMIDEKIVLEQSEAAYSQKSEQNLSQFDAQSDSSTKRPLSMNERSSNPILEKVQAIAAFAKDLLRFNSEFDSYNQLYLQIAFDAGTAAAFFQSFRSDRAALPRAVQSEIELKKIHEQITNDPLRQFSIVSLGDEALIRGKLDSKTTPANDIRFLESKNSWRRQKSDSLAKNMSEPLVIRSNVNQKHDLKIVFNDNLTIMMQPEFREGVFAVKGASLFARAAGTILATSLASAHAIQAKFAFMKEGSKFVDVDLYFFGKKVVQEHAGKKTTVLAVSHVFKKLNAAAKKHEQIVLKGTIGIAAILGAYFAAKAVKNTAFLFSKSKLYKRIKRKIDLYFL